MLKIDELLAHAGNKLENVRDAMAALAAQSAAGRPKALLESAANLEASITSGEREFERVRRLVKHLGVSAMGDAATKLCSAGRPGAAQAMLRLQAISSNLAASQADIGAFLGECLESLESTMSAATYPLRGGRLLGSA